MFNLIFCLFVFEISSYKLNFKNGLSSISVEIKIFGPKAKTFN